MFIYDSQPYLPTTGDERFSARVYAAASVALSLLTTLLLLKISSVQSAFNSALSEKDQPGFYHAVWGFVGIIIIATPLFAINEYIDARIAIEWRNWMARSLISAYLGNRTYFRLKIDPEGIDNPDQRICDDVRSFAGSSVGLAVGLLRQLFYCVAFAGLLASLAPKLVFFLFGYAFFGTFVTTVGFGRRLTALSYTVLQREADLRYDLVRVRENAESCAFYKADVREASIATGRLIDAVAASRSRIALQAQLSLFQNAYSYATILIPSLTMAPLYFAGQARFGDITQVSFAFNRIEASLSYIVNNLSALSSLAAETERLDALLNALGSGSLLGKTTSSPRSPTEGSSMLQNGGRGGVKRVTIPTHTGLEIQNLTLNTPHGERTLCRNVSLNLAPGQSLLIVGPSGAGKSSMMRAIAGLWSVGGGSITTQPDEQLFFLPQKPYMPLGTLRQQLCFPDYSSDDISSADSVRDTSTSSDEELAKLLDVVALPDLMSRVGGLDAECDWAHMLSLGEQQRVAFLRLLRKRPAMAFLDEATSGLDDGTERRLYAALKDICSCYVSVGHRKELLMYHTHVLEAVGGGNWVLKSVSEYNSDETGKRTMSL